MTRPSTRAVLAPLSGAIALTLLTGAAPAKPATQWLARPSEAARVAKVEAGLSPLTLPGEAPVALSIPEWMALYDIPGLSIAVFDRGELVWAKAYGVKQAGGDAPVTLDTRFQAASISKPVTALAALHHAEAHKWSLDEDVNTRLVSWKVPENDLTREQKVTLRRLLSHTAGLTVHGFRGYAAGEPVPTLKQILDGEKPANSSPIRVDILPGSKFRYSGGGFTVVQQLLEDQLHQPFARVMQETVLTPLGMKDSTFEQPLPAAIAQRAATGTRDGGASVKGGVHVYPEQAAAGLWTTPSDLARLALEVSKAAQGKSRRLLSRAMAKQLLTRQPPGTFGLGFGLPGGTRFAHGGANEGFRATLLADSATGSGVVVMTNSDNGSLVFDRILASVAAAYDWKDYTTPAESPWVTADLIARRRGVDATIAWFRAERAARPTEQLSPDVLNEMGYILLKSDRKDEALKVFEANVSIFPENANAHDSLGEAYLKVGRKAEAATSYRKSLALDPKNANAVKVLEQLGAATK